MPLNPCGYAITLLSDMTTGGHLAWRELWSLQVRSYVIWVLVPTVFSHDDLARIQCMPSGTKRCCVWLGEAAVNWELQMPWTEERVVLLKKLLGEGMSASQIAKELGGVTRNAVIGKIHRMGLSNRPDGTDDPSEASDESTEGSDSPEPANDGTAENSANGTAVSVRKTIVPADQPLPPQPSANEVSAEALANVREVEQKARKISLLELTERTCKWPIGDPATDEFWFCGLPAKPGKPYCEAHISVAFQPPNSRRDRRR